MKKKTKKVEQFIDELHDYIVSDRILTKNTLSNSETEIQREIRTIIINFLVDYFKKHNYKDFKAKAHKSFYWEGQDGQFGRKRKPTFGSRNYPDFIIQKPYLIAIEYKQSKYGSTIKQGIGQSIIHTLSRDFDYVYLLFRDQNKDDMIAKSSKGDKESVIIDKMWNDYNVRIKIVPYNIRNN